MALFLVVAAMTAQSPSMVQAVQKYVVTWHEDAKRVHVEADLELPSGKLSMFGVTPTPTLRNGQADLIESLVVMSVNGPLAVTELGEGDYELPTLPGGGPVHLSYDLRLEHQKHAWPAGAEEVAYPVSNGWVISGNALFLAPTDTDGSRAEVRFVLPKGWSATTPWPAKGAVFEPASLRELVSNVLFVGTPKLERVTATGIELTIALGPGCEAGAPLFTQLLRKQLETNSAMFGGKPETSRYLIIVNRGATGDGGAFASSFSQLVNGEPSVANRVVWGHVMAHELLHFWNGLTLVPMSSEEEWFKEGVTDYLTITTLARSGVTDRGALFERLANIPRRLMLAKMQGLTMSTRAAGADKQKNRLLVYGGGAAVAMAMDVELRKQTKGKKGLPELMAALFKTNGHPGSPYTMNDILKAGEAIGGGPAVRMFLRAVDSDAPFDMGPTFTELGLSHHGWYEEQFVSVNPKASAEQKARFEAIFGTR